MPIEIEIFWVFFKISWLSFGGVFGVLPELERILVHEHQWISSTAFYQSYIMGQFVPGPNMAMCPLIGYWVSGWTGFVAGFLGIYSAPLIIMALAYGLYKSFNQLAWLKRAEQGLRPVVFGLTLASLIKLWFFQSASDSHQSLQQAAVLKVLSLSVAVLAIVVIQKKKIDSLWVILGCGVLWLSIRTTL